VPWIPVYTITAPIARSLMEIEAAKVMVEKTPLPLAVVNAIRHRARIRSTHYSTQIEGNRLTLKEARDIVEKKKARFHGRERDVNEVRHYWDALLKAEDQASRQAEFTEDLVMRLHGIIEKGSRARPTPYRDGQNVIRDSRSGRIVYLPPEAHDVPLLMGEMVRWVHGARREKIPVPLVAALVHYQFVTFHPYYDGNGRTARLLSTFILQRDGYGLNGFFSLEEYHAHDLNRYYTVLASHTHHNYYEGRAHADITPWIDYFTSLLAKVYRDVKDEALEHAAESVAKEPEEIRRLDHRARRVLSLFAGKERVTTMDMADVLGLSSRMVRVLVQRWVKEGWLVMASTANRSRAYTLSAIYRQFIGNLSAQQGTAKNNSGAWIYSRMTRLSPVAFPHFTSL